MKSTPNTALKPLIGRLILHWQVGKSPSEGHVYAQPSIGLFKTTVVVGQN